MNALLPIFLSISPLAAQFIIPEWRGSEETSHAEWDVFTVAKFAPNKPDIVADDAILICTTSSAFMTSGGNIYSFQAAAFFQIDDFTGFPIRNVFLQMRTLGSGVDAAAARLIATGADGETVTHLPTRILVLSEEELGGERGGVGTVSTLQWDLQETPVSGIYTILFNATESSLSLDKVSLETSRNYLEVKRPKTLEVLPRGGEIVVNWLGSGQLQSSPRLDSGWLDVVGAAGENTITLPIVNDAIFFRVQQVTATE